MVKYILFIICSTLLLNSCKEPNTMPKGPEGNKPTKNSNTISLPTGNEPTTSAAHIIQVSSQTNTNEDTTLAADEKQKFNALKAGLDTILKNKQRILKEHKENIKRINEYYLKDIENILNKYPGFIEWLENNLQKKKELANAFTPIYDFLNEQRIKQSSTLTTEQLIINTLNCYYQNQSNASCNDNNYAYNNLRKNFKFDNMYIVFDLLLTEIDHKNTNEERFEALLQDHLLKPDPNIANLIGTDRLEEMIRREKLNDSQRQGLDFLKEAFINLIKADKKLYIFLLFDINKIKVVLDHINSELLKCSGDNAKKNTFKSAIKNYFDVISDQKLNEFVDKVKIDC